MTRRRVPSRRPRGHRIRDVAALLLFASRLGAEPAAPAELALAAPSVTRAAVQVLWTSAGVLPPPEGTRSIEVTRADEPVYRAPSSEAPRRGALALGSRLPVFGVTSGFGCAGRFVLVGPLAFMCEAGGSWSREPPAAVEHKTYADGMPYRYHFVGADGSLGYRDLETAEEGMPDSEFLPGFGVALVHVARKPGGDAFGLTTHGFWLPMRDLGPAAVSAFHGEPVDVLRPVLWVIHDAPLVTKQPAGEPNRALKPRRLSMLPLLEERRVRGQRYFRFAESAWISERDARTSQATTPPEGTGADERWLDVDLDDQVLTAYAGSRPVYATLVSSGRGPEGSELSTPKGEYRIWVKLASSDMDNLDDESARENYAIQAVPWVMYFERGYGLHGTFWHDAFGTRHSHGCVNLSPLDAKYLFDWTLPHLPAGWSAVLPTEYELGTRVRVH